MKITQEQLRKIIKEEVEKTLGESIFGRTKNPPTDEAFGSFVQTLSDLGLDPDEDDIESQITDFANARGYDPELFYDGFGKWMKGRKQ